jgi:hypothetical protein
LKFFGIALKIYPIQIFIKLGTLNSELQLTMPTAASQTQQRSLLFPKIMPAIAIITRLKLKKMLEIYEDVFSI